MGIEIVAGLVLLMTLSVMTYSWGMSGLIIGLGVITLVLNRGV